MALQVLAELKHVLKEDAVLELNVSKTSILPKGVTQQAAFDVTHIIISNSPALTPLNADFSLASFCPEGFIGIGVPIGADAFVRNFVRAISNTQMVGTRLARPEHTWSFTCRMPR